MNIAPRSQPHSKRPLNNKSTTTRCRADRPGLSPPLRASTRPSSPPCTGPAAWKSERTSHACLQQQQHLVPSQAPFTDAVCPRSVPVTIAVVGLGRSLPGRPRLRCRMRTSRLMARAIGYGLGLYRQMQVDAPRRQMAAAQKASVLSEERSARLENAYGDRSSLEELEAAVRAYEAAKGT